MAEPKGQLLLIDGKTEDEVRRSLERVLLTMRITTSEPKVQLIHPCFAILNSDELKRLSVFILKHVVMKILK